MSEGVKIAGEGRYFKRVSDAGNDFAKIGCADVVFTAVFNRHNAPKAGPVVGFGSKIVAFSYKVYRKTGYKLKNLLDQPFCE